LTISYISKSNRVLSTISKINSRQELLAALEGGDIGDDVLIDSCPAESPNREDEHEITQHLQAAIRQKQINIENGKRLNQSWSDAEHWRRLAKEHGYTLPHRHIPLSTSGIEKVLHQLNVNQKFFRDHYGPRIIYQEFVDLNPDVPLWVFAGWILESISNEITDERDWV